MLPTFYVCRYSGEFICIYKLYPIDYKGFHVSLTNKFVNVCGCNALLICEVLYCFKA